MEKREQREQWKDFLNKEIKVIVDDPPKLYPKFKQGILIGLNETHLILKWNNKTEAIRLSDIRRIERRDDYE